MANDIRKLRAEGSIDVGGEGRLELSGKHNVCERNTLSCKVCAGSKVLFEDGESGTQAVLKNGVDLERGLAEEYPREMTTHGLVVGANVTLDELKDKGVVAGNISIDKRNPLVN